MPAPGSLPWPAGPPPSQGHLWYFPITSPRRGGRRGQGGRFQPIHAHLAPSFGLPARAYLPSCSRSLGFPRGGRSCQCKLPMALPPFSHSAAPSPPASGAQHMVVLLHGGNLREACLKVQACTPASLAPPRAARRGRGRLRLSQRCGGGGLWLRLHLPAAAAAVFSACGAGHN